jgi:hypothetical protein
MVGHVPISVKLLFSMTLLPGLDVSLRGAVSIARRLQDPMAELVKIDPQSLGVGHGVYAKSTLNRR